MMLLLTITFFIVTSAFSQDAKTVRWTSDTTYEKNGVEYLDPSRCFDAVRYREQDEEDDCMKLRNEYIQSRRIPPPELPKRQLMWYINCYVYLHG